MSASDVRTSPILDRKAEARAEEEKKNKKFKRRTIAVIVALVVVVIAVCIINSSLFYTKLTAVQVGDTKYTAAEYSYYVKSVYNQFYNNYGYSVDTTSVVYQDEDGNDVTWGDYFKESALDTMVQTTGMYNKALEAGYTLSEDDQTQIDSAVQYVELYASSSGYSTDAYLAMAYCKGMDEDMYRSIVTRYYTAVSYASSVNEGFTYTDDELEAYFQENAADLSSYTIRTYCVFSNADVYDDLADDTAKAEAAHAAAEEIAAATTEKEFADNVYNYVSEDSKDDYADEDSTLTTVQGSDMSSYYKDWVTDSSRQALDTTVIDIDGTGSYAIMFVSSNDNHYATKNVRHILIQAEEDDDGNVTEEAIQAAEDTMNEVLDKYNADPTEDNFIALVEEYSDDSGSNTSGGLYENVYKGEMVDEFDAFCFDSSRQYGDIGTCFVENSTYTGYHIIFFIGDGMQYSSYLAQEALRTADYDAWLADATDGLEAVEKFAARFVTL